MWERVRGSIASKVAIVIVALSVIGDLVAPIVRGGNWHSRSPAGTLPALFLIPLAVLVGVVCGVFLVKEWPNRSRAPDTWFEDRDRAPSGRLIEFAGAVTIIPVLGTFVVAAVELGLGALYDAIR